MCPRFAIDPQQITESFNSSTLRSIVFFVEKYLKYNADCTPLYQSLGGTSAERLAKQQRSRTDGMSQSRIVQLVCGSKVDFLLVAESGPGATNDKELIVPKFGNKPENRVAVGMTFETFAELILTTYII